jgi:arabinose-5-phosphate isomerase
MKQKDQIKAIKSVIGIEIKGLRSLYDEVDENFSKAVDMIADCKGRVIFTGIGKSGLIARKIAATFSSVGISSFYLDPAEGVHGDLGVLVKGDIVIGLSKSGTTAELCRLVPYIKRMGICFIAMTSNSRSELASESDLVLKIPDVQEACPYNLAPTTSTTMQLVLGDALAIVLLKKKGFTREDFALLHPGGNIGKQLIKVRDLMHKGAGLPLVRESKKMGKVLQTISRGKPRGIAIITNDKGILTGIIVDGDLKRILIKYKGADIYSLTAEDVMTRNPKVIREDKLVVEALAIMEGRITSLVVVDGRKRPIGLLHMHDIIKKGFV